jgi:hypothetical protein
VNVSTNSFDINRELGVILTDTGVESVGSRREGGRCALRRLTRGCVSGLRGPALSPSSCDCAQRPLAMAAFSRLRASSASVSPAITVPRRRAPAAWSAGAFAGSPSASDRRPAEKLGDTQDAIHTPTPSPRPG